MNQVYLGSTLINDVFLGDDRMDDVLSISPSIVTDGLQTWVDAGNPLSYPGSGSTWTDLSGNGRNYTLVNSPTFTTLNGGALIFNGIDEYMDPLSFPNPNGELTIEILFNYTAIDAYHNIFERQLPTTPMMWIDPNNKIELNEGAGLTSDLAYNSQNILSSGVISTSSPGLQLYVNSTLVKTVNTTQVAWPDPWTSTWFGRPPFGQFLNATVYSIRMYNRRLTASEVLQNYTYDNQRFI
jgi:hypothetical protein